MSYWHGRPLACIDHNDKQYVDLHGIFHYSSFWDWEDIYVHNQLGHCRHVQCEWPGICAYLSIVWRCKQWQVELGREQGLNCEVYKVEINSLWLFCLMIGFVSCNASLWMAARGWHEDCVTWVASMGVMMTMWLCCEFMLWVYKKLLSSFTCIGCLLLFLMST